MRRLLVGLLTAGAISLACASHAKAADFLRHDVFGTIGIGKTYDDEGSLGSGINGGGGYGYRVARRLGVQAEVNAFRTRREFSPQFAPFEASGAHVMGSALLYLNPDSAAKFYLIGGAGLLHSRLQTNFAGAGGGSANGFGINFGGGVKIFATPRFSIRPELRIFCGNSGNTVEAPFSDIRISVGAGYHW